MAAPDTEPTLAFADADAWERWLDEHHERAGGAWLRIARKGSREPLLTLPEALDVALCFGWIDSHRRAHDAGSYLQRYSPRRPASPWSQVNREKAEALVAAGRMRPAGLRAIEAARADGRWDAAYAPQRVATVPPDLAAALDADPRARERFDALDRTARYALLLRLMKARSPAARATQLARVLASLGADREP